MNWETVTFVRIYLTETEHKLDGLIQALHDEEHVRGVSVFRAVSGFGQSGRVHSASLLDLSLDLPLVVEFFDTPEKVERILKHLAERIDSGHMVRWQADVNV